MRRSNNWPYLALLVCIILPLLWIAFSLAIRSGMFRLSGAPNSDQLKLFLAFIGGAFATAATVVAALFTREHNERERQRLRLETVIKILDSLPTETQPRMAGLLSTMVPLGQQRIAIRVLEPAWERGDVDHGTATWLIGQVLTSYGTHAEQVDGDRLDEAAIVEATLLLAKHADQLTDVATGAFYFPGHFLRHWRTESKLPRKAKDNLLRAIGRMLLSGGKGLWSPQGDPPEWPTVVLVECAQKEPDPVIRSSAAVLLAALNECFPNQFKKHLTRHRLESILNDATKAAERSVDKEYLSLAGRIRKDWGSPTATSGDSPGLATGPGNR